MAMTEELWWQNLQEWILDDNKIVTYKNLACNLEINVNAAKEMLATFYQDNTEKVLAFYLIYGQTQNGLKIQMTTDKDLKKVEVSFKKILSKHVFALCKANMDVSSADMLNSLENECSPCQMICLRGIKNLKIQVKEQAEKV